jgi:hypothetical protein
MKSLFRLFSVFSVSSVVKMHAHDNPSFESLSDIQSRREALGSLAGRVTGRTCCKSLIINNQMVVTLTKIIWKCPVLPFPAPLFPNLSGVIRSFALKPVFQARQEWKTGTETPALKAKGVARGDTRLQTCLQIIIHSPQTAARFATL